MFAPDETSLLPISWLDFRSARFAESMLRFHVNSVFPIFQEILDIGIQSNQLIQRFLKPASVVLVIVEGSILRGLVDGSNKPSRLGPLGSALSLQLPDFRV